GPGCAQEQRALAYLARVITACAGRLRHRPARNLCRRKMDFEFALWSKAGRSGHARLSDGHDLGRGPCCLLHPRSTRDERRTGGGVAVRVGRYALLLRSTRRSLSAGMSGFQRDSGKRTTMLSKGISIARLCPSLSKELKMYGKPSDSRGEGLSMR